MNVSKAALTTLFGLALGACNATDIPKDAKPAARTLISAIKFEEPYLAKCVQDSAEKAGITYADELKELTCHGNPKWAYMALAGTGQFDALRSLKGLNELSALEYLDVSQNWLWELDTTQLPKLRELKIANNLIQKFNLSKNTNLEILDVSCNPITSLMLPALSTLKVLNASASCEVFNRVSSEIRDSGSINVTDVQTGRQLNVASFKKDPAQWLNFSQMKKLEELNLSQRELSKLDVSSLRMLIKLDLTGNKFTDDTLPALDNLTQLTSLYLSSQNTPLHHIPHHPGLKKISITGEFLNDEFKGLTALESLYLEGQLDTFNFSDLTNLKSAQITATITTDDPSVYLGAKVESLFLSTENTSVHFQTGEQLKSLNIHSFRLEKLGTSNLMALKQLDIYTPNSLKYLNLPAQLEGLSVYSTQLETVILNKQPNLKQLDLSYLPIKDIDLTLAPNLTDLRLANINKLGYLDLTPVQKTLTSLFVVNASIAEIKANDLGMLEFVVFQDVGLTPESKANIEKLTGKKID